MAEHFLDASGLICPLPVLKARKVLEGLPPGEVLRIRVTDTSAPKDFELYCAESGHIFQGVEDRGGHMDVQVKRRAP